MSKSERIEHRFEQDVNRIESKHKLRKIRLEKKIAQKSYRKDKKRLVETTREMKDEIKDLKNRLDTLVERKESKKINIQFCYNCAYRDESSYKHPCDKCRINHMLPHSKDSFFKYKEWK
jgi:hypothetical protein